MGTNYYVRLDKCEHCGRYEELHIGKNSYGWNFALHVIPPDEFMPERMKKLLPEEGLTNWKSWLEFLRKHADDIYDEYGNKISLEEFKCLVEERPGHPRPLAFSRGLREGHAPGLPIDYIEGEFS